MTIIQDPAYRMMMSPPPPAGADRSSVEELVGTLRQGDCSLPVEVDPLEAAAEHYSEVGFAGRCMAIWPVPDRCFFWLGKVTRVGWILCLLQVLQQCACGLEGFSTHVAAALNCLQDIESRCGI